MTYKKSIPLFALALVAALSASAQPTRPLTLDEVHCDQDHLMTLLRRSEFLSPQRAKPIFLTWTFGTPEGDFSGFAHTDQWFPETAPFNPEKHLWVSLEREAMPLLRDPSIALKPTYTLSRLATASDLLPPGNSERLEVRVRPTASESEPIGGLLRVDNLVGGMGTSTKRGLALVGLEGRCHADFTAADLHAMRVLTRVIRSYFYSSGGSSSESPDYLERAIVYRGTTAEPLADGGARTSFRVDAVIHSGFDFVDQFAAEVLIDIGTDGRLGAATIRQLPECTTEDQRDCTSPEIASEIFVTRPMPPGRNYPFPYEAYICKEGVFAQNCLTEALPFDFAEVLRDTAWAKP